MVQPLDTAKDFIGLLEKPHIQVSMDGKDSWCDNVFVERLWKSVKYEEVYLHAYESVAKARRGLRCYLLFYKQRRAHSVLDGQTPDMVYSGQLPQPRAAWISNPAEPHLKMRVSVQLPGAGTVVTPLCVRPLSAAYTALNIHGISEEEGASGGSAEETVRNMSRTSETGLSLVDMTMPRILHAKKGDTDSRRVIMEKFTLFLLSPGFSDNTGGPYYCPSCAAVEGFLRYFPEVERRLDVRRIDFSRPRKEIIELIGDGNQGCPVLILGKIEDLPQNAKTSEETGVSFISESFPICEFLGHAFGAAKPHP